MMNGVDADILGKLNLLQSKVHLMQSDEAIATFICRGLSELPCIAGTCIFIRGQCYGINSVQVTTAEGGELYNLLETSCTSSQHDAYLSEFKKNKNLECLKIETSCTLFGFLFLKIDQKSAFEEINPYIKNTLNLVALIIENSAQKELLVKNQSDLEQLIELRTAELKACDDRFRALANSSRDGIIGYDPSIRCTFWNPAMELISGIAAEKVVGNYLVEVFPFFKEADVVDAFQKTNAGETVFMPPMPTRLSDNGRKGWFVSSYYPVHDDRGRVTGGITIINDITDQKRAYDERHQIEEQLRQAQKMEAIGTLAGGIAHDFNNILSIIIGNAELALDDTIKDASTREFLVEILGASLRAKDLIKQILDFSRKSLPEKEPLPVVGVLKEAMKLIRSSIPSSVKINMLFDHNSAMIHANPTQINQILLNLCSNAAYAMNYTGQLDIIAKIFVLDYKEVGRFQNLSGGGYVKISVCDTGKGMKGEELEKIFDPYYTTKEVGKGSGLGLSVVYGIVRSHGGEIKVYSKVDQGTTFDIYLPILETDVSSLTEKSGPVPHGRERILFIDDELMLVQVAEKMLTSLGYRVLGQTSSLEALEVFKASPDDFDLVISDMAMPDLTGSNLAIDILKIRPDIPIILCTGHSETIDGKAAREIGIRRFLMKPLTKQELAEAIRQVLDSGGV